MVGLGLATCVTIFHFISGRHFDNFEIGMLQGEGSRHVLWGFYLMQIGRASPTPY